MTFFQRLEKFQQPRGNNTKVTGNIFLIFKNKTSILDASSPPNKKA